MKLIKITEAIELMQKTNGKIFSAVFIKGNGDDRHITCRLGVSKGVKGIGRNYDPAEHNLFPVYDMVAKGFRQIRLDTLKTLQIDKQNYVIKG